MVTKLFECTNVLNERYVRSMWDVFDSSFVFVFLSPVRIFVSFRLFVVVLCSVWFVRVRYRFLIQQYEIKILFCSLRLPHPHPPPIPPQIYFMILPDVWTSWYKAWLLQQLFPTCTFCTMRLHFQEREYIYSHYFNWVIHFIDGGLFSAACASCGYFMWIIFMFFGLWYLMKK